MAERGKLSGPQATANALILEAMMAQRGKISGTSLILQPTTYTLSSSDFKPARPVGKPEPYPEDEDDGNQENADSGVQSPATALPKAGASVQLSAGSQARAPFPPASGEGTVFNPDSDQVFFSPTADLHGSKRFQQDMNAIAALKKQLAIMRLIIREKNEVIGSMQEELWGFYKQAGIPLGDDDEDGEASTAVVNASKEGEGTDAASGEGKLPPAVAVSPGHRRSATAPGVTGAAAAAGLASPTGASVVSFSLSPGSPSHRRRSSSGTAFMARPALAATIGTDLRHSLDLAQAELVRYQTEAAQRDLREKALSDENASLREKLHQTLLAAEALANEVATLRVAVGDSSTTSRADDDGSGSGAALEPGSADAKAGANPVLGENVTE